MFRKTQFKKLNWQPNAYNACGQVTDYLLGDDYRTLKSFNDYGFTEQILTQTTGSSPNNIQNEGYNFDEIKGNLMSRINHWPYDKTESFYYDNLNRLTNENVFGGTQLTTSFTNKGNITQKSDIGTYTYGDAGPHAVTGLTSTTGSLLPANNQTIDYTAFSKASHIGQGGYDYFITYGTDRQRSMSRLINGITEDILQTKYYAFGDYEKEITPTGTRHLHYISGGDGLAAIYVKYDNAPDSLYFIMTDHLGSIVGAINSATGTVFKQNFDAWGRKRNPVNWSYTNIPDFPFDRGYTGHEHLKWFGLINMNGRMYDAALCRFLSPDPYVQHPGFSQSYNRYTYCLNNPLKYIDPSGYNNHPVWIDVSICWEAYGLVGDFGAGSSGLGPGSGNHWSNQYRNRTENFMLMSSHTFTEQYGEEAYYTEMYNLNYNTKLRRNSNGDLGYYVDAGSNWSKITFSHNAYGNIIGNSSGEVFAEWVTIVSSGNATLGRNYWDNFVDVGSKINNTIDYVVTGTTGFVVGVQKLGNAVSKDYPVITKLPILSTLGKLTGAINIANNINEFRQDPYNNWWNGVEAIGQIGFIAFGGAQANLVYNLSVMTIDLTIDGVNYYKKRK